MCSGILPTLSQDQRRQQEAIFEIVSSEASYLKSLNILVFHFASSSQFSSDSSSLSSEDRNVVFSNIKQVSRQNISGQIGILLTQIL